MLSVLSYNVHFGKRLEKIIFWLLAQPAFDVICFQEFPQHAISLFAKAFTWANYGYRFAPFLKRRGKVYGELTLFRKDKLTLMISSTVSLGIGRGERMVLRARIPRTSLLTTFRYKRKQIAIMNVHLANIAFNALRYRQIKKITKRLADYNMPSVLMGDFNMSSIFGRKKLFALMRECGYETFKKRLPTHRIAVVRHQMDYVFWKGCTISSLIVHRRVRFSDHLPFTFTVTRAKT